MKYVIVKDVGTVRYVFNGFTLRNGLTTKWSAPSLNEDLVQLVAFPTMEDVEEVMNNIPAIEREGIVTYQLELVAPK